MNRTITLILASLSVALIALTSRAQTTFTNLTSIEGATNWAVIPYFSYDTTTRKTGGGGVVLYSVTPNFWAGVRAQSLKGQDTLAGVQAQLQATITWNGVKVTPFVEASTGMGNSSLYSNAGTGGLISFHTWKIGSHVLFEAGAVADYEHYIYGSNNGNQINVGPLFHLSF